MNLLYLANSIVPSRTANSVHVMKMCSALADNRTGVVKLYVPDVDSESDVYSYYGVDENFDIVRHKKNKNRFSWYSFSLRQYIYVLNRESKDSLIYGRNLLSCMMLALSGYKVIYECHSPISRYNFLIRMLFSLSKSNFIKIVVISEKLKDILFQEGVPSDKIEVLHDAADETPEYLLEKVTNSNFNIGYIGHLYEGRGADLVIEVAKKIPNANFHFYGGEESDISNLKNIIDSSNIYFHGFLPPAKIPEVRASLDLLLAPYQESTSIQGKVNTSQYMSPLKIFEYMSSNRPFICSDLPVLREVLVNEHNCILVKPDCIEGWVDAINRVISNQEFSDSIANNALNDFKVKYTWKNRAIKIRGMFDESV